MTVMVAVLRSSSSLRVNQPALAWNAINRHRGLPLTNIFFFFFFLERICHLLKHAALVAVPLVDCLPSVEDEHVTAIQGVHGRGHFHDAHVAIVHAYHLYRKTEERGGKRKKKTKNAAPGTAHTQLSCAKYLVEARLELRGRPVVESRVHASVSDLYRVVEVREE